MNPFKRHFYNGTDYEIDHKEKVVKLLPSFHQKLLEKKLWPNLGLGFKKIGGSSLGDVLLTDSYKSQFKAFCRIAWIDLPILDRKYVDAGIAIEPIVISKLQEDKRVEAIETFSAKQYNYDYFKDVDPILGGLPDGLVHPHGIVLEIKTTGAKNITNWKQYGVPVNYIKQAQLYAYLMKKDKFVIAAAFLDEDDYKDPEKYNIDKYPLFIKPYFVNTEQVKDDIVKIKEFYEVVTTSGISPKYDEKLDSDLLEYLECSNKEQWDALVSKWINEGKAKI